SPDGRLLHAQYWDGQRRVAGRCWQLATRASIRDHDAWGFAFSPDSSRCAANFADGSLRIIDLATGREERHFSSGGGTLAWHPRQPRLAQLNGRKLRIVDVHTGEILLEKAGNEDWYHVAWHPGGDLLALSVDTTRQILLLDPASGAIVRSLVGHRQPG